MNDLLASRREFFFRAGRGFSGLALASMLPGAVNDAAARAERVIYIFNHGRVSHVDTWDPKPTLARL